MRPGSPVPGRMSGRLERSNPHRHFLRRKLLVYLRVCALVGAAVALAAKVVSRIWEPLGRELLDARSARVPREVALALERAAEGDSAPLLGLIPRYPLETLSLLLDQESCPRSMGSANPLARLPKEASDRILRECAPLYPVGKLRDALEALALREMFPGTIGPRRAEAMSDPLLTMFAAHPDPEAVRVLRSPLFDRIRDDAFQERRSRIIAERRAAGGAERGE